METDKTSDSVLEVSGNEEKELPTSSRVKALVGEIMQLLINRNVTIGEATQIGMEMRRAAFFTVPHHVLLKDYMEICERSQ
jgi:hypothetical protein